ncbi:MAG: GAF domain-containing protein [Coriobacteriia bacterium]|nr:GAF domain-containing protein [Coriobacteriia bacterium]
MAHVRELPTDTVDDTASSELGHALSAAGSSESLAAHRAVALVAAEADADLSTIVQALKSTLGLSRACIHLLGRDVAEGTLRLGADAGAHAAFLLDAESLPLDSDTPAAHAVTAGEATWQGDQYDVSVADHENANGVGRWRAVAQGQASATVPLRVRGRITGALTLEWPEPHDFDETERGDIEAIAAAVALAVEAMRRPSVPELEPGLRSAPARSAAFLVSPEGAVSPAGPGAAAGLAVARVSVATTGADAGGAGLPFADVFGCDGGVTAVVLGAAGAPHGSVEEYAEAARHMLRGWLARGIGPADALGSLAAWAATQRGTGAWLAVTAVVLDPARRFVVTGSVGPAVALFLGAEDRLDVDVEGTPLLGAGVAVRASERARLLLPHDRLVLISSDRADCHEHDGMSALGERLQRTRGIDTARAVILRDAPVELRCEATAVVEMFASA